MASNGRWKLYINKPLGVIYASSEDWIKAREQTPRKEGEGDIAHRNRAWSAFTKQDVRDWEWEDL